jgi:hypothetical protein
MHGDPSPAIRKLCGQADNPCLRRLYSSRAECETDLATSRRVADQRACEDSFDATFECEARHAPSCDRGTLRTAAACEGAFKKHRECREVRSCAPFAAGGEGDPRCGGECLVSGYVTNVHCTGQGPVSCSCTGMPTKTPTFEIEACDPFQALRAVRKGQCRPDTPLGWSRDGRR